MRRPIPILLAFHLVSLTAAAATDFHGRVVGVTDGDTLKVLYAGRAVRVRLYGPRSTGPTASGRSSAPRI